jgi:hypothetical protein
VKHLRYSIYRSRVLTCLGMMSVLLLTFTVSSNGYHKAYASRNLDALGTKIRVDK